MIYVIKESWFEFLGQFKSLIIPTAPWILASIALNATSSAVIESYNGFTFILISLIELILKAMIAFTGLRALFKQRSTNIKVSTGKVLIYIFASIYIGVATMLGLMLFIIPGLIIMAASFFVPIFVLKDGQGPIEAVASSASLLRGNIFKVTLFLCILWLGIMAVEYIVNLLFSFLAAPELLASAITSGLLLVIGLVTLPVMVNFHEFLTIEHNTTIQPTPEGAG